MTDEVATPLVGLTVKGDGADKLVMLSEGEMIIRASVIVRFGAKNTKAIAEFLQKHCLNTDRDRLVVSADQCISELLEKIDNLEKSHNAVVASNINFHDQVEALEASNQLKRNKIKELEEEIVQLKKDLEWKTGLAKCFVQDRDAVLDDDHELRQLVEQYRGQINLLCKINKDLEQKLAEASVAK